MTNEQAIAARRPSRDARIAPHTEVRAGGRVVARATTVPVPGSSGGILGIRIEGVSGHQPPWARRLLVHDLLSRARRAGVERVNLTIPAGDSEILDALHEHSDAFAIGSFTIHSSDAERMVEIGLRPPVECARAS